MTYLSLADKGSPCHCPDQPEPIAAGAPDFDIEAAARKLAAESPLSYTQALQYIRAHLGQDEQAKARILRHHHVCVWESTLRRMTPRVRVNAAVHLPSCGVAA